MRSFVPDFELVTAPDLSSALDLLKRRECWRPIAGGTDLMVLFNAGKLTSKQLVNVRDIAELKHIKVHSGSISIGAAVTYSQVRRDPSLQAHFPLLCAAASWTGGISNQNRGTLGGNIVNASPAADSPPALLVYDAELELASREGTRRVSYSKFHTGYKEMQMTPDELLIRIHLPLRERTWCDYSRKVGARRAQAISKVCLAASAYLADGLIRDVRFAMGSVAPFPMRCSAAENALRGKRLDAAAIGAACEAIRAEISPISDVRSTAEYRSQVASNLVAEFLGTLQ